MEHGDIVYYHVDAWARRVPSAAADSGAEPPLVFRTFSRYRQFSAFNDRLRRAVAQADDLSDVEEEDDRSHLSSPSHGGSDKPAMPASSPLQALHRQHPSRSTKYARHGHVFDRRSTYLPPLIPDSDDEDDSNQSNGSVDEQKQQPQLLTAESLFDLRYEPPLLQDDMLEELPEFPIKRIRLLEDHLGEDFIRARIVLLNNYLKKLTNLPGLGQHIVLLRFAGAATRDFSGFRATG